MRLPAAGRAGPSAAQTLEEGCRGEEPADEEEEDVVAAVLVMGRLPTDAQ